MALIACRECGKQVSTEAAACPHCGAPRITQTRPAPPKQRSGCATAALVTLGVLVGIIVLGQVIDDTKRGRMSPEEHAEVSKRKALEDAERLKREAAFQRVVIALRAIKSAMRNPDSVVWETIRANDDASVICVEYRAQNGFGGMNRGFFVVAKEKASDKRTEWNRWCLDPLNDMKHARQAL